MALFETPLVFPPVPPELRSDPKLSRVAAYLDHLLQFMRMKVRAYSDGQGLSVRVYNSGAISIANTTVTALTFNSERWDPSGMHDAAANTHRLTAKRSGLYDIYGLLRFANNTSGFREAAIRHNGTTMVAVDRRNAASGTEPTYLSPQTRWRLEAGEWVDLAVQQDSGAAVNVEAVSAYTPEFGMDWVTP